MEKRYLTVLMFSVLSVCLLLSFGCDRSNSSEAYRITEQFNEVHGGETHYYIYMQKNQNSSFTYRIEISQYLYDNLQSKENYPYFYPIELNQMGIILPDPVEPFEFERTFTEVKGGETLYYMYLRKKGVKNDGPSGIRVQVPQFIYDNPSFFLNHYPQVYPSELGHLKIEMPVEREDSQPAKEQVPFSNLRH